jgi:hypothetical protein
VYSKHAVSSGAACHAPTLRPPIDWPVNEKYLVVYKRVGGEWKIAYDIWNSDASAPPEK